LTKRVLLRENKVKHAHGPENQKAQKAADKAWQQLLTAQEKKVEFENESVYQKGLAENAKKRRGELGEVEVRMQTAHPTKASPTPSTSQLPASWKLDPGEEWG